MQNARMHCYRFGSICLFSSGLLAWLAYSVTHQLGISTLNLPIYEFFVNLHTPWLQQFAQAVTQLGNKQIIFPLLLLFTGYFAWQKNGALAMTTASLAVSSMLAVWVLKHGLAIPRPEALFIVKTTYSFPVGILPCQWYFLAILPASYATHLILGVTSRLSPAYSYPVWCCSHAWC
jgi:hypothetical protein